MVFWLNLLGIIFELPTALAQFILDIDFTVNIDAVGYYTGYIIGMFLDANNDFPSDTHEVTVGAKQLVVELTDGQTIEVNLTVALIS
jgi:hypothetical protein